MPAVVSIRPLPTGPCEHDDLIALAASAAAAGRDAFAQAIVRAACAVGIAPLLEARDFSADPSHGLSAWVAGWVVGVRIGGRSMDPPGIRAMIEEEMCQGRVPVVITLDRNPVGMLGLADAADTTTDPVAWSE